jgi:hypothetical protein
MPIDDRLRRELPVLLDDVRPDVEAELDRLLVRAQRRGRVRRAMYAGGLAAAAAVAAVTVGLVSDGDPDAMEPAAPEDQVRVLDSGRGTADDPKPVAPGRYAIPFIGAEDDAVWGEIVVPVGWRQDRLNLTTASDLDPHLRRIELFAVDSVAEDPCVGALWSVGPEVRDVVKAVTEQRTVRPGAPRRVSVDGYSGRMVRVRVPADLEVTRCWDGQSLRPFGVVGGAYTSIFPGWTVRVWILDVEDERLLIMAAHGPGTTRGELAELTEMVEGITIVGPR